jgi:hypothetical protein
VTTLISFAHEPPCFDCRPRTADARTSHPITSSFPFHRQDHLRKAIGGRRVFIGLSPSDAAGLRADKLAAPLSEPGSTFNVRQEVFQDETHKLFGLAPARMLVARPSVAALGSRRTTSGPGAWRYRAALIAGTWR